MKKFFIIFFIFLSSFLMAFENVNHFYTIKNFGSQFYLNIRNSSHSHMAEVDVTSLPGNIKFKQWMIVHYRNNQYLIINHATGLYLTIHDYNRDNRRRVEQAVLNSDPGLLQYQLWTFEQVRGDVWYIKNIATSLYLNLVNFNARTGALTEVYQIQNGANGQYQKWVIDQQH